MHSIFYFWWLCSSFKFNLKISTCKLEFLQIWVSGMSKKTLSNVVCRVQFFKGTHSERNVGNYTFVDEYFNNLLSITPTSQYKLENGVPGPCRFVENWILLTFSGLAVHCLFSWLGMHHRAFFQWYCEKFIELIFSNSW